MMKTNPAPPGASEKRNFNPAQPGKVGKMRAYILSEEHGTVQIGDTVFQPCTGARFRVNRKRLRGPRWVEVRKKSMEEAVEAMRIWELSGAFDGREDRERRERWEKEYVLLAMGATGLPLRY
jgi:hypothetical protein